MGDESMINSTNYSKVVLKNNIGSFTTVIVNPDSSSVCFEISNSGIYRLHYESDSQLLKLIVKDSLYQFSGAYCIDTVESNMIHVHESDSSILVKVGLMNDEAKVDSFKVALYDRSGLPVAYYLVIFYESTVNGRIQQRISVEEKNTF